MGTEMASSASDTGSVCEVVVSDMVSSRSAAVTGAAYICSALSLFYLSALSESRDWNRRKYCGLKSPKVASSKVANFSLQSQG